MPKKPRYERLLERISAEVPKVACYVPRQYFGDREVRELIRFLFARHAEIGPAIDYAMQRWIADGQWPDLDWWNEELRYFGAVRLMCAMDTLNLLLQEDARKLPVIPDPSRETDDATLLKWLLIDSWNGWRWDTWLKLEALRVDGGDDSFYGPGKG